MVALRGGELCTASEQEGNRSLYLPTTQVEGRRTLNDKRHEDKLRLELKGTKWLS